MITIKDIAKEANVSPTTVSNVINGNHTKVSQKNIEKIQSIIEKYNYIPNLSARSLVNNASKIIGVIIPEPDYNQYNFLQNPFNTEILSGIERTIRESGYYLMIRSVSNVQDIQALLQNWNVAGILIIGAAQEYYDKLVNISKIPMVFIDSYISDPQILNVGLEDLQGGYLATSYLLQKGHTKIGLVSYETSGYGVTPERFKGYQRALQEYGVPFTKEYVFEFDFIMFHAQEAFDRMKPKLQELTALFCAADLLAMETMEFLRSQKLRVPDDISIVGFDDLFLARMVTPKLTTIRQDIVQKGIQAAELVVQCLQNKEIENRQIVLPVSLIERDSVKTIKDYTTKDNVI